MDNLCQNLNDRQKEAVITTEGPVMVMAGAGSGKTRVLTRRIAYLIKEKDVSMYNILAVTFTNKAANEMKERLTSLLDVPANSMWVSTFHSFCARFLRMEIEVLGTYTKKFQIIDSDDSEKTIRNIIKAMNLDSKEFRAKTFAKLISKEKNNGAITIKDKNEDKIYHEIFRKYQEKLVSENLLDFDDLILLTLEVLKKDEVIRNKYQNKFKYILVDEFQDTNFVQYELVKILASKYQNIFIVGDEDQSIYSFRGARVENIQTFKKDFKDTKVILLEENYRSVKPILDIANKVILNNKKRIEKNLFTSNTEMIFPKYYPASTSYEEQMYIVDEIKKLKLSGYKYSDMAIMYRANYLSRGYEEELVKYKLPYEIYGGVSFFSRKEIKDICAYLRLIVNNNDDFSFERIVNEPKRKIGPAMLTKLRTVAVEKQCSLFEAIDYLTHSGNGYNSLIEFKFIIIELNEDLNNEELDFISIVDKTIEKTGYKKMLSESGEEGSDRLDNILELKSVLISFEKEYADEKLSRDELLEVVLQDLALRTDNDKVSTDDKIKLLTYHQAKGLEFKVVFMVAMEEGIFPNYNTRDTDEGIEEERRICYVGITRARERLYLTNASNRYVFGHKEEHHPSSFIDEIGTNELDIVGLVKKTIPTEVVKPVKKKLVNNEFEIGDVVTHDKYGDGRVVELKGKIATIAFKAPIGIKKMLKNHPSLSKK